MPEFKSYSQAGQDKFAYETLCHKRDGTYLEIGCAHPTENNNTYALEMAGWRGISIDISDQEQIWRKAGRSHRVIQGNALTVDYASECGAFGIGPVIDYLSLDVDQESFKALKAIPTSLRFRVITIEHDAYRFGETLRQPMREYLTAQGYVMLHPNVECQGYVFEDWWVDPQLLQAVKPEKRLINEYFDKIFCINLARRTDRWKRVLDEAERFGITLERFEGYDLAQYKMGNHGCTASHRHLMEYALYHDWKRILILEDDFHVLHFDFHARFEAMLPEVPDNWDLLYLGGHYADKPQKRVSEHVIKFNRMKTTSSVGITRKAITELAASVVGVGPIDEVYSNYAEKHNSYIFSPRLMDQCVSFSDIQGFVCDNSSCMRDTAHERMV